MSQTDLIDRGAVARVTAIGAAPRARGRRTGGEPAGGSMDQVMAPAPSRLPLLLTYPEAVQLTGLSRATLYRMVAAGELRTVHRGRSVRLVTASLLRWIANESGDPVSIIAPSVTGEGTP